MNPRAIIVACSVLASLGTAWAEPLISEFMAANDSTLADENGDYSDWLEIHNPDAVSVDLAGWRLTDEPSVPAKWTFPAVSIPAGGYLVVFASDKNRAVSGSELHTNFKITSGGEYLALIRPDGSDATSFDPFPPQQTDVSYGVPQGSQVVEAAVVVGAGLRFLVPTGTTPGWNGNSFDDTAWTVGSTGIGYEDNSDYDPYIASDIEAFCRGNNATVYLRIPFTVDDPTPVTALELQLKYDDGFAAYLNGQFLASDNVPGTLAWNSDAPNSIEANLASYQTWDVSSQIAFLVAGTNTLAIQMLNQHVSSSSDFLMVPRLELTRSVDSQPGQYDYFTQPTPGAINNTATGEPSGAVSISESSGVKAAAVSVTLVPSVPGADIRYTTDGAEPGEPSTLYSAPLSFSTPTRLRARAFQNGKVAGPVAVADYAFIDPSLLTYLSDVPVIVMDNFGAGAYPNKGRSNDGHDVMQVPRQANVMGIFDVAGNSQPFSQPAALESRAGCRVRGSSSANFSRKPLSVEFWDGNDSDLSFSPFGMQAEADWVLYAPNPTFDRSLVHNPVAFGFGELIGALAPKYKVVAVFQNTDGGTITASDMAGVYVFMEKIERGRMGLDFDRMDDTGTSGGWMVNVDRMDAIPVGMPPDTIQPNFHCAGPDGILSKPDDEQNSGGSQSVDDIPEFYHSYLNFDSPNGYAILPAQRTEVQTVTRAMDAAIWAPDFDHPVTGYAAHIDSASWARYYATHNFAKNNDMIALSTYYYRETPTSKMKMGPIWDVDRAFTYKGSATSTPFAYTHYDWFEGLWMDDNFKQVLQDIWQEARSTTATDAAVAAVVDDAVAGLRADQIVASGLSYSTWLSRVTEMRNWVVARVNYIDSQYEALPGVSPATELFSGSVEVTLTPTAGGTVYYTTDGTDPRTPGGGISPSAEAYTGPFTLTTRTRLLVRTRDGTRWSGNVERNYYQLSDIPRLVISEIAYHPADPSPAEGVLGVEDADDFEYIEIQNIGASAADLSPLTLAGGVAFDFAGGSVTSLAAGARVLVVRNGAAFAARYGSDHSVAGVYVGKLNNAGDRIVLQDTLLDIAIQDFFYDDVAPWPACADGFGFSLVLAQPESDPDHALAASWRASANPEGSPGEADPDPPVVGDVLINEVMTHTDLPQVDTIELQNPTGVGVDIGGWFLTDDVCVPRKFRIPDGTLLPAGGFTTYNETDFNADTNLPTSFQLRSTGEEVWLFSGDAQSNLTGFAHGFAFGAAENGVSFGRYVTTVGEEHFPAQSAPTPGAANAGPRVGPVVISEIMYHPAGTNPIRDEYIELTNLSGGTVPLYDPSAPTNTWRVRNAVGFDVPPGVGMDAQSRILLVGFDPLDTATLAAFRAAVGLDAGVPVYGPWTGTLDNVGATLELLWPDSPNPDGVPYVLAEKVAYASTEPWPPAADGTGSSLQRIADHQYGNDPDNWYAAAPRPGAPADLDIDSDGDAMNDWAEWKARTNPSDPDSYLHLAAPVWMPSGVLEFALYTVAGRSYALDCTTNLVTQPFAPSYEDIEATGEVTLITITNPAGQAFFRLRVAP